MDKNLSELMEEANEKFSNEDYSGAFELYKQIVETEKKHEEAMIYMLLCLMRLITVYNILDEDNYKKILIDSQANIAGGLDNIKNRIGIDNREYVVTWLKIYKDFFDTIIFFHNNCVSYLQEASERYSNGLNKLKQIASRDVNYTHMQQIKQCKNNFDKDWDLSLNNYTKITSELISLNNLIVYYMIEEIKEKSLISSQEVQELFDSVAKIYHLDDSKDIHTDKLKNATQGILYTLTLAKNEAKNIEIEKYWEDKQERKKELEDLKEQYQDEKAEIHIKIDALQEEITELEEDINNSVKEDEEKKQIEIQNQNELIKQKNSLGLFKGKEKNLLQNKIDEIQNTINQLDSKINIERKKARDKYQPIIEEKNTKIQQLQNDIDEIEKKEKIINKELYLKDDE